MARKGPFHPPSILTDGMENPLGGTGCVEQVAEVGPETGFRVPKKVPAMHLMQ